MIETYAFSTLPSAIQFNYQPLSQAIKKERMVNNGVSLSEVP